MSAAITAIERDRAELLAACRRFPASVWGRPSGCAGWSVQDLLSHMDCSYWLAVDPGQLPDPGGLIAERAADRYVESRRAMSPAEVIDDFESVSARGLEVLAAIEVQDGEIPLGDVGTYPAAVVPAALAFEAFVHIRYDLFAPGGPVDGPPPAVDQARLGPTLDWIEAALPQQNRDLLAGLTGAVEVRLDGLSARTVRVGDGDVVARVSTDSRAFVGWVTQRATWEQDGVRADGDPGALAITRRLRVF